MTVPSMLCCSLLERICLLGNQYSKQGLITKIDEYLEVVNRKRQEQETAIGEIAAQVAMELVESAGGNVPDFYQFNDEFHRQARERGLNLMGVDYKFIAQRLEAHRAELELIHGDSFELEDTNIGSVFQLFGQVDNN